MVFKVVWFAAIFLNTVNLQKNEQCKTPTQDSGDCIPVRFCQPVTNALQSGSTYSNPLRPEIKAFLGAYKCGSSRRSPKVCCPSKPINIEEVPPLDVSDHKNLYLLPKDCGYLDTSPKIIGGKKAELFEFPWMALLSYKKGEKSVFFCGGTIINERYILTAAHCVTNLKYPLFFVRVGEHDLRTSIDCEITDEGEEICAPPHQDLKIEETVTHPEFNVFSRVNDIALIRVTPMNLSVENCRPICLPLGDTRNINLVNTKAIVTGWGVDNTGIRSSVLLKVNVPVLSLDKCRQKIEERSYVTTTIDYRQLCAGEYGKDACTGDSGGPLHTSGQLYGEQRFIQKGIVSYGPSQCGIGLVPTMYTKTDFYMKDIKANLWICLPTIFCTPLFQCN